ncbi:MAG: glycine zipper domain-containing protein, partial [Candidatus Wallbacteria bacterium]
TSAKPTIMEKLGNLKEKVTTPIEGGGKSSEAFQKGYNFGKETPTKLVDKVKGVFTKDSAPAASETPAVQQSVNQASSNNAASGNASNVAAKPAVQANVAEAPAAASEAATTSAKPTIMEKLGNLKEKVTTPIEGGGKNSEAFQKGYKFGKETPEKIVGKVKGVFTKDGDSAAAANESASTDQTSAKQTPSQKLSDPKNSKVEFNEKTGQFEKASQKADLPVPQAPQTPSKLSVALGAGKDALKSSFSVKNLAVSAGLTVGFKVLEQVKNGESISIGKAVGHLATGEFAGSFVGSGLGSAAGSVVGSLLGSTIPVVGPVLGAFMPALFSQFGGQIGSSMGNDLASGQVPSFKKAIASIDKVALIGSAAGSTIGAALGSMLMPGIGTMIGGMVGSFVGNIIVNKIRSRAKSNYNVAGVNASTNQVIFSEQIAPPPAYNNVQVSTASAGTSVSGSGDVQSTYDKMVSAYKSYSQYLAEGKGETTEGQEALAQYKQYYTEYANASGATGEGK